MGIRRGGRRWRGLKCCRATTHEQNDHHLPSWSIHLPAWVAPRADSLLDDRTWAQECSSQVGAVNPAGPARPARQCICHRLPCELSLGWTFEVWLNHCSSTEERRRYWLMIPGPGPLGRICWVTKPCLHAAFKVHSSDVCVGRRTDEARML